MKSFKVGDIVIRTGESKDHCKMTKGHKYIVLENNNGWHSTLKLAALDGVQIGTGTWDPRLFELYEEIYQIF